MTRWEQDVQRRQAFVDALLEIKKDRFEVWKYFEDRAAHLSETLWSTGVWLMSILGATVTLPFAAKFIVLQSAAPRVEVTSRIAVAIIALFGLGLSVYSYAALMDLREHIESNWFKSSYALEGVGAANWGGRKQHGWNVLMGVGGLSTIGFVTLLVLAIWPL